MKESKKNNPIIAEKNNGLIPIIWYYRTPHIPYIHFQYRHRIRSDPGNARILQITGPEMCPGCILCLLSAGLRLLSIFLGGCAVGLIIGHFLSGFDPDLSGSAHRRCLR